MNLLICSNVSIPGANRYIPEWRSLDPSDYHLEFNESSKKPDVIVCMSISCMHQAYAAVSRWPTVPLFVYHWDCYSWVWTRPRVGEYDYKKYGELLKRATEVWVPSFCTGLQANLWWDLTNWYRILCSVPYWDYAGTSDEGYVFCPLRKIPDVWSDEFENACKDVGIPFFTSNGHGYKYSEYQDVVAKCRFLVSHYEEASTGGLSLLEGYHIGKPCLINGSDLNGAKDYFGDRAEYFICGDRDDFRAKLSYLYEQTPLVKPDHRSWVEANFNDQRMLADIMERVHANS